MMITFFLTLASGFALGCIYTLIRSRRRRDIVDMQLQSLKQTAKGMIDSGNLAGLNPHKVYKFCEQYEQLKAERDGLSESVHDMCEKVSAILRDGDYVEDIYYVPESSLFDILEKNKKPKRW
jgi:hypothetical protein